MAKRKTQPQPAEVESVYPTVETPRAKVTKVDPRLDLARTKQAAVGPGDSRSEHYWRGVVAALEGKAP